MRNAFLACFEVLATAWRANRIAFAMAVGEVVSTVLRFIQPLVVAWIVHAIAAQDASGVVVGVAVWALALGAGAALEVVALSSRIRLIQDVGHAFDVTLMKTIAAAPTLNALEAPDTATAIDRVRDRADVMGFTYNHLMTVVIQLAAPVTSLAVAVVVDWRLAMLLLAGAPTLWLTKKSAEINDQAEESASAASARLQGWLDVLGDASCRAERQVFGTWPWMRRNVREHLAERDRLLIAGATRDGRLALLGEVSYLIGASLVVWWVVATRADITAGALVAMLLVAMDMRGTLGALRYAVSSLGPGVRAAVSMRELRQAVAALPEIGETGGRGGADGTASDAAARAQSIAFVDAAHVYADGCEGVTGLSVELKPGQLVAVVGENGAGKSTFAEMVLGVRAPTSGQVTRPGSQASAVMQGFARPELLLGQSIALRDIGDERVRGQVWQALERATSNPMWRDLPDGLGTQLGASQPGGRELSGGQWQTVAAARAQFASSADVIVLDEPTSALDPQAQEDLAARYVQMARRATDAGGVAVFITHRMSMPRLADRILVFDAGRIVEDGTHEELIRARGAYWESYRVAIQGYTELGAGSPPTQDPGT